MPSPLEAHEVLLNPIRHRIYAALAQSKSIPELAREVDATPSTIRWHVTKLVAASVAEFDQSQALVRRRQTPSAEIALGTAVLHSIPARELLQHLLVHPWEHLGQAALHLKAPRSRYWRAVHAMEDAGLLSVRIRVKARLLAPSALALEIVRKLPLKRLDREQAGRQRRARF